MPSALKVVLTGRVQGVGFREFVQRNGQALRLSGYVTNLPDGSLEVYGEGDAGALRSLLRMLQAGPSLAEIADVKEEWVAPMGQVRGFEVRF